MNKEIKVYSHFDASNPQTYELDEHGNIKAMGLREDGSFMFIQSDPDKRPKFEEHER